MKIKITRYYQKKENKFKIQLISLIKNNINFPNEVLKEYIKNLKKISSHNHLFLSAEYENNVIAELVCNVDNITGVSTIIWLVVLKDFQRKKVGNRLIKELLIILKKNKKIHKLRVFSYKKKINEFYLKNGFQEEGFYKDHWFKYNFWSFGKILKK